MPQPLAFVKEGQMSLAQSLETKARVEEKIIFLSLVQTGGGCTLAPLLCARECTP